MGRSMLDFRIQRHVTAFLSPPKHFRFLEQRYQDVNLHGANEDADSN